MGRFKSSQQLEDHLNTWLQQYVDSDPDHSGAKEQAKWPLLVGNVMLNPVPERNGCVRVMFSCQPNYQLEGLRRPLQHDFLIDVPPGIVH